MSISTSVSFRGDVDCIMEVDVEGSSSIADEITLFALVFSFGEKDFMWSLEEVIS